MLKAVLGRSVERVTLDTKRQVVAAKIPHVAVAEKSRAYVEAAYEAVFLDWRPAPDAASAERQEEAAPAQPLRNASHLRKIRGDR